MAKGNKTIFYCSQCGYESAKWMGQCPACKEWNSFVEEPAARKSSSGKHSSGAKDITPVSLSAVSAKTEDRMSSGMSELDRVLGGGVVPGSLVLVGGDPGIGKSTLLLQVCRNMANNGKKIWYISGEESLQQIRLRAERIGSVSDRFQLICETSLSDIAEVIRRGKPEAVVIDSIQTMYSDDISSAPGSVSQIRQATAVFMQLAKTEKITIFVVGHVTKEGVVAGPRVLEHMVDTVLYFEGDRHASYRILRAVKNRFGSTNEIGVFEMRKEGLIEVPNPSEYMLNGRPEGAPGSIVACSIEGTRPILLEVQALVSRTNFGFPRRTANGAELNRLNMLLAVLEKRAGLYMGESDAYINIAGGIRMNEPALDLAIALALASSASEFVIPKEVVCFGEIGLAGEIRGVSMAAQRVQEVKKLGFEACILPKVCLKEATEIDGIALYPVSDIRDAIRIAKQLAQ